VTDTSMTPIPIPPVPITIITKTVSYNVAKLVMNDSRRCVPELSGAELVVADPPGTASHPAFPTSETPADEIVFGLGIKRLIGEVGDIQHAIGPLSPRNDLRLVKYQPRCISTWMDRWVFVRKAAPPHRPPRWFRCSRPVGVESAILNVGVDASRRIAPATGCRASPALSSGGDGRSLLKISTPPLHRRT
jgi:hypothetical protein